MQRLEVSGAVPGMCHCVWTTRRLVYLQRLIEYMLCNTELFED